MTLASHRVGCTLLVFWMRVVVTLSAPRVFGVCILGATRSSFVRTMGASWVRLDTPELA